MQIINHPVTFHRDFRNDFPLQKSPPDPGVWENCQRVALATMPLLSLHRSFRGPLSLGMSSLRSVTHFSQTVEHIQQGHLSEGSYHLLNASLATTAVGLFFFNPVYCFLSSSISDLIINARQLRENANLETLGFLMLDPSFVTKKNNFEKT
ncbi:MAG: hypothetical protein K1000chlam2_00920 [Chlamydiae bacterium]|nr:hypothetical protein [Chlamydiota bacterium]